MRTRPIRCVRRWTGTLVMGSLACFATVCTGSAETPKVVKLTLTSTAFAEGQPIPAKHTADGADASPLLAWTGVPEGAKSLALLVDDPDAPVGIWTHWVLYGLPPDTKGLPENVAKTPNIAGGARQGVNDFHKTCYGGPAPPPGKPHRYVFTLFALDRELSLPPGATRKELLAAVQGHVLAQVRLTGTYQRSK